jgi:hypothetical protein
MEVFVSMQIDQNLQPSWGHRPTVWTVIGLMFAGVGLLIFLFLSKSAIHEIVGLLLMLLGGTLMIGAVIIAVLIHAMHANAAQHGLLRKELRKLARSIDERDPGGTEPAASGDDAAPAGKAAVESTSRPSKAPPGESNRPPRAPAGKVKPTSWKCPDCGVGNMHTMDFCAKCGTQKPD